MQMKNKLKEEKASIAVYVFIVLLGFLIILSSMYAISSNTRKDQLQTIIKIKESYELINKDIENIYQSQLEKNNTYIQEGLVLHYDAINNTGTGHNNNSIIWKDLSGHEHDGELHNFEIDDTNSPWTDDGLKFDGTDSYVNIINPMFNEVGSSPNMTIEILSESKNAKYENILTFTYMIGDHAFMDLWTAEDDNRGYEVMYYYNLASEDNTLKTQYIRNTYPLNKPIAITYGLNDTQFFSYANGTDKKTIDRKSNIGWDSNKLYLGRPMSNHSNYYFSGTIKSVRIYNRELSRQEVEKNYEVDKIRYNLE